MASEVTIARGGRVNPTNAISQRTMAYDRDNALSAIGKRAFSLMTNRRYGNGRGGVNVRNYERIQRAAYNMQQGLRR